MVQKEKLTIEKINRGSSIINIAVIFSKYLVSLMYGKNRFSYVVSARAIRFS